eukprot:2612023-Rhodomonas_salina.2
MPQQADAAAVETIWQAVRDGCDLCSRINAYLVIYLVDEGGQAGQSFSASSDSCSTLPQGPPPQRATSLLPAALLDCHEKKLQRVQGGREGTVWTVSDRHTDTPAQTHRHTDSEGEREQPEARRQKGQRGYSAARWPTSPMKSSCSADCVAPYPTSALPKPYPSPHKRYCRERRRIGGYNRLVAGMGQGGGR